MKTELAVSNFVHRQFLIYLQGETTILIVSDAACARLADMLLDCPEKIAARIVRKGDRISLGRDQSRPGDKVIKRSLVRGHSATP